MSTNRNLTRTYGHVEPEQRHALLGQRGAVVWLTGLSGSGKSTIAYALERALVSDRHIAYVLDGDNVRHGLNADLGFSPEDRDENIRRVGEAAALFAKAGVIAIASFISPYRAARDRARACVGADRFIEVFLDVSVDVCERRDPKGLYAKARAGEIKQFTGVSAPYERPDAAQVTLDTDKLDVDACVAAIVAYLNDQGSLQGPKA